MTVSRVRTGLLLILTGVALLLNTTGVVDWDLWENLLSLWPVLLIAIGIEKIFSASERLKSLAYVSPIVIVATFAYAVTAGTSDGSSSMRDSTEPVEWFSNADASVKLIKLSTDFGGGRLVISGGASADRLAEGRFYHRGGEPRIETRQSDSTLTVTMTRPGGSRHRITFGSGDRERWIIKLGEKLPVDLSLNAGGAQVRLDLVEIPVERLALSTGAADVDVSFGSKSPMVDCDVDCGAASIDVTIPAGAGLRVSKQSAVSTFSAGQLELIQHGEYMETPDYDSKLVKVMLRLEAGASTLRIHVADGSRADVTS